MSMNTKVVINFDTKLFKKEHIILAAQDYTEPCWVLVDGSEDSVSAILIPKDGEIEKEELKDEFYNYVLATVKNY
ncbi:MAG: hypothetical protein GF368_01815 [Candidatus Aenigmarchaeota archaeon]|nr:hypothetical protein [Candidatus Aenigmarchaeota archaeon]